MTVSDKILPIRFYNDLFDQNRFNKTCHDTCQFDLVYPPSKLPHFQFKRDAIFASPSKMFLRNVCNDVDYNYYKEIPEGVDNFCNEALIESFTSQTFPMNVALETVTPAASYLVDLFAIDCCKIKMLTANIPNNVTLQYFLLGNPYIVFPIASNTDKYHFKIVVDKLIGTSTIQVKNGSVLLGIISAAGSYEYTFTSQATNVTILFDAISYGDYLEINYVQATRLLFDTVLTNDVLLSANDLKLINLKDGTDVILYCNQTSYTSDIPYGSYYYVIVSGGDYYFSEVFKIVSLKDIQQLYRLKWNHDCDFNSSVLYSLDTTAGGSGMGCSMENILYLDAGLIKPEYDTQEESEVNGQGDLNVRFKRWQKNITFEIGKSPQFLTDALSAVFLHKNISVLEPLNFHQDVQNNEFSVLKSTSDISDILYECYQSVKLKLLLEDKITDTACCNLAEIIDCTPCDYEAGTSMEDCAGGYYITIVDGDGVWWTTGCTDVPRYSYILTDCNGNIVNVKETDVICYGGQYIRLGYYKGLNCAGSLNIQFYYLINASPVIATAAFAFIGFYITGTLLPNTWGKAYFQIGCTGAWILADTFQADSNGDYVYLYTAALMTPYLPFDCVCFKVENVTPNCNFGTSNTKTVGIC